MNPRSALRASRNQYGEVRAAQALRNQTKIKKMSPKTCLKICGITNIEDVRLVNETDADYSGFLIDVGFSERSLALDEAVKLTRESNQQVVILLQTS